MFRNPSRKLLLASLVVAAACTDATRTNAPIVGEKPAADQADLTPGTFATSFETANLATTVTGGLQPIYSDVGRIYLSVDGTGMVQAVTRNIQVDKHAGATVRKAFLFASKTSSAWASGSVLVDGVATTWIASVQGGTRIPFFNYAADITDLIKPRVDAASAGLVDIGINEVVQGEGTIIAVVLDDPSQAQDNTVSLMFGGMKPTGDDFFITLANPLDAASPTLRLEMGLGISFGFQLPNGFGQSSQVTVNGTVVSGCAGGQDDGESSNSALLTVGGIGDSPANPNCSANASQGFRADDELYDLRPFVQTGDQLISVHSINPSQDDNIFFAGLFMTVPAQVTVADATPPVITPVVTGTLGDNGWYTSDVAVTFTVADPESPITSPACAASSLTTDSEGATFTCSATNDAGLSASASVTVKRDATKPTIGYTGNTGDYTVDQSIAITCTAGDEMSGLATNTCQDVTGAAYMFALGSHTYSASATDNAGNGNLATTASRCASRPARCAPSWGNSSRTAGFRTHSASS
jgi:hypothetical protein